MFASDPMSLVFLALAVLAGPWILAAVALRRAARTRDRLDVLEGRLERLQRRVERAPGSAAEEPLPPPPVPGSAQAGAPPAAPPAEAVLETSVAPPSPSGPAAVPPPLLASAAGPTAPPPAAPAGGGSTLEEKIALVWFTRIGALALILGAAYFFKYAVDNEWIGPAGRVALGALAGVALLAAAEAIRSRSRAIYVQAVLGTGAALLFVSAYASHALYRLVPAGAAFAAVAVVALLGGALAVRHRGEIVLVLSLVGGLLAPVFLSTGEDRPLALFGYLLVLTALALAASARLGFRYAPWFAIAGTSLLFAGWWGRFFEVQPARPELEPWGGGREGAYHPLASRTVPLAFAAAFVAEWIGAWAAERRARREGGWGLAVLLAALLLGHLAFAMLLHDRAWPLGTALVVLGALSAVVLRREGRPGLLWAPGALAVAILFVVAWDVGRGDRFAWLAAAGATALAYLAAVADSWIVRKEPPSRGLVVVAAGAGLAFVGLTLELTTVKESILRAALLGATGAAELALGAGVLARLRSRATVLLGVALGLFAGAAALLFSGATITLVWAALAAVAAVLAAREEDPWWLGGAGALFLAVLLRLASVDLPGPAAERSLYFLTLGRDGALLPRFLLNPRTYAFAGAAAALFVAAWNVARVPRFRLPAAAMASAGHALLLAVAVMEVHRLVFDAPPPPVASDAAGFRVFEQAFRKAVHAQGGRLDMATTLVLGAWAALLVGAGFAARSALHRWLGLALFAVTLGKLALWDVWRLSRLYQIGVFTAVGALLLAASYLYARHGSRLLGLLKQGRGGPGNAVLLLLAAGSLLAPGAAFALDVTPYRETRPVAGVSAPGLWQVEVDADLYRHSLAPAGTLADVRLAGPGGEEVPWALRPVPAAEPERQVEAALVDPVVRPDGSVRAALDLGKPGLRHSEVRLDLMGDEFLREARIETSEDGRRWGLAAEGGRVYAVKDLPEARRTFLRYPASDARWLRVTLLPGSGAPPRILGARLFFAPISRREVRGLAAAVAGPTPAPGGRRSRFEIDLGAPGIPVNAVVLRTAAAGSEPPPHERAARVYASADRQYWSPAGAGLLWRAPEGRLPAADRENARIAVSGAGQRWLRVEIEDGDAPPLPIAGARVEWLADQIVFRAGAAGPHVLYVGDPEAPAPAYDLAAVLRRTPGVAVSAAAPGPLAANPRHAERARVEPFTERHRGAIAAGLLAVLAGLAIWVVLLLRPGSGGPGPA
jgi:hypothetical protein